MGGVGRESGVGDIVDEAEEEVGDGGWVGLQMFEGVDQEREEGGKNGWNDGL